MKSVVLLAVACSMIVSVAAKVHLLTEDTFEHDTQAASGATTGNWFIMFKSEGCGYCREAQPVFEALADEPSEVPVNFAIVDCDASDWVCNRFEIRNFPTFLLLSRGQQYAFKGSRTTEAFKKFFGGGYLSEIATRVPAELSATQKALSYISINMDDLEIIREHAPWLYYTMAGAVILMGVMLLLLVALLISQRVDAAGEAARQKKQKAEKPSGAAAKKKQ